MRGNDIINLLVKAYENKDADAVEQLLITANNDGLGIEYSEILCTLLLETWHEQHEDILMMLEDIKDPTTVGTIIKSMGLNLDYYTGNDIPRKAIWALTAIRSAKAIEALKKLTNSQDEFTRTHAEANLKSLE